MDLDYLGFSGVLQASIDAMKKLRNWTSERASKIFYSSGDRGKVAHVLFTAIQERLSDPGYTTMEQKSRDLFRLIESIDKDMVTIRLNERCAMISNDAVESENYEAKRRIQKAISEELRHYNLSIRHPTTKCPCNLLVVATPDGKGNYVLEDRATKKRTNSCKSISSMLPIVLMRSEMLHFGELFLEDWLACMLRPQIDAEINYTGDDPLEKQRYVERDWARRHLIK